MARVRDAEWRSYCPSCDGFLLDPGPHFDGRVCGTCHSETVAARWQFAPDGQAVLVVVPRGTIESISIKVNLTP